jgi:pimeloyl-ACP methyl ester carboxylesterase
MRHDPSPRHRPLLTSIFRLYCKGSARLISRLDPTLRRLTLLCMLTAGLALGCSGGEGDGAQGDEASNAQGGRPLGGSDEAAASTPIARFNFDPDLASTPVGEAPFPHDAYRDEEGALDLRGFQTATGIFLKLIHELQRVTGGFGTTGGLFVSFEGQIDIERLPQSGEDSLLDASSLSLIDIDPSSPEYGRRWPIYWKYQEEAIATLPTHTLCVRLLEGVALRPQTTYALIVTEDIARPNPAFTALLGEMEPEAPHSALLWNIYEPLRAWLDSRGARQTPLALGSVFTTQDPVSELFELRDFIHQLPRPEAREITSVGVQTARVDYELFRGRYTAPRFQEGEIPYRSEGGAILFSSSGEPIIQGEEDLRFSIAVPTTPMPEGGWPIVLYAHGTGGNYESYFRGEIAVTLARMGIAVASIDQIHHGERDGGQCDMGGDYGQCVSLLFFNFLVPSAGRDNVRQSALDYVTLMRMVQGLEISADLTEAGQDIQINSEKVMFMGHSQGGLNGPLFMAVEPQVLGGVLSGAGANIAISMEQKTKPFNVNQIVRLALGVQEASEFSRWHPALTLLQTFIEPGDSANYGRFWFSEPPEGFSPKSILMTVGLLDEYTPPDTTFSLVTSGRVPIAAPIYQEIAALEALGVETPGQPPFSANVADGQATAALIQYDTQGHFLIFNLPSAKERYGKFLKDLANRPPPQVY